MNRIKLKTVFVLMLAVATGFVVENIKVNVNYVLERGSMIPGFFDQDAGTKKNWMDSKRIHAPFDYYHNHKSIDWLYQLNQSQLVKLKWFNTVLFTLVFMLFNAWLMKSITGKPEYYRWTIIIYAVFFTLSFGIYIVGRFTGTLEHAYGVSRKITGALHSLVPLMILLPASWLMKIPAKTKEQ